MCRCQIQIGGFNVVPCMDHYEIYKNGKFVQSCDSNELNHEIYELLHEQVENKEMATINQ